MKSLKAVFSFLLIALMTLGTARAGQVTGTFATPGGSFIQNATITFTLSQLAVKTDASQTVAPSTVSCYTSVDGSLVGLPNPQASPVLAATSGSMTAGTYYEVITYWNASGETIASPEQSVVLSSSQGIQTTSPGLQPAGASGYKIYVGIAPGGEVLQATVTGFATTSIGSLIGGSSPPISNSTPCNIAFNDTFIPAYTTYRVSPLDSTGSPLPGFPQSFYLQGSTVNLNTMLPASGLSARFPQPIVASPINTTTQSINSNLSLNGHNLLGAKSVNSVIDLVGSGCKGDGATDDKACIATVLAAAGALSTPLTVCITDNHTFLIGTNPGGAQVFTLPSNVSLGCKGTIKIGNSFGIYHALFKTSAGASFTTYEDFTVDGNATNNAVNSDPVGTNERVAIEVIGGSSQSVEWHNIKFINGNDVQTIVGNPCNDCTITENKWSNYGIGGTFDHDSSEIYFTGTNGTVALNEFDAAGIGVRTAIEVHQDNKTVIGNIIHNYRYGIITSANQAVAHNFSITGNTCDAVYRCVYIWAVDGSTDGLIVSGNQITINRNGFWTPTNDEAAIGTNLTNTFDLLNTKITGNNIRWIADTLPTSNTSAGISLTDTVGGFNLNKVEISGNKVDGTLCAGILAETLGLAWSDLVIKNNEITNPGQTNNSTTNCNAPAFRNGISLVGAGAGFTIKSSIIEGNHIADTQVTPTMQIGVRWIGVAGDGASGGGTGQPGLVSRNNTVSYVGTPAQTTPYVLFSTTSPEYHESVPNFTRANAIDSGEASPSFPPKGSSIYDPISGRTYVQTVSAVTGRALQSFENTQSIPVAGAYSQGDIAWNQLGSTNGTCGWYNVVSGSPGSFTSIPCNLTGSKVFVTTDFTTANNTNLQAITGLSWTFPAVAANYSFHCSLLYSQATAAVADQFGIQAVTNNPTNIAASALAYSSSSASTLGTVPTLATTTATPLVTFTPSATTTVFNATLEGTLELAASANTVNIMVQTSAGADAVTVKRGSYCQLF